MSILVVLLIAPMIARGQDSTARFDSASVSVAQDTLVERGDHPGCHVECILRDQREVDGELLSADSTMVYILLPFATYATDLRTMRRGIVAVPISSIEKIHRPGTFGDFIRPVGGGALVGGVLPIWVGSLLSGGDFSEISADEWKFLGIATVVTLAVGTAVGIIVGLVNLAGRTAHGDQLVNGEGWAGIITDAEFPAGPPAWMDYVFVK